MEKTAGWAAILIILAVCAEIVSFVALTFVPQFDRFLYRPPEISQADYDAYIADRDPVLGWPSGSRLEKHADEHGARPSPANIALSDTDACISVYGDSFAFSDEVEDKDAWANVLAKRLECRVNNYGVGGYGSDQAVLRLEQHLAEGRDLGDTWVLTMYPDNLNRHMNQWRHLLTQQPLTFKPAFRVAESGEVVLEPIFDGDFETFRALTEDPAAYLPAETYLPDGPGFSRMKSPGFPYSLPAAQIFLGQVLSFRGFVSSGMSNFYNFPSHYDGRGGPSDDKKAVTAHIVQRFAGLCETHNKQCAFVITPDPEMVLQHMDTGTHDLKPLLEDAASGVIFLDATEMFTDLADICAHVTYLDGCKGHYNPAGYARLAEFIDLGLKNATGN